MVNLTDFFKPADFLGMQITTLPPLNGQGQNTENECRRLHEKTRLRVYAGGGGVVAFIRDRCNVRPTADLV